MPIVDSCFAVGISFDKRRRCNSIGELGMIGIIGAAESLHLFPHVSASPHVSEIAPRGIDGCIIIMTIFVTRIKLSHPSSRSYPD